VRVVVLGVVDDDTLELSLVPDDGAIEEFTAYRSDLAFGKRVGHRRADRTLEDLEPFGPGDLVEGVDKLAPRSRTRARESASWWVWRRKQVAGCLGRPGSGRVSGDAGVEHLAGGDVDEEQYVVAV